MCDCVPSTPLAFSLIKVQKAGLTTPNLTQYCSISHSSCPRNDRLKSLATTTRAIDRNPSKLGSEEYKFYKKESGFNENGQDHFKLESSTDAFPLKKDLVQFEESSKIEESRKRNGEPGLVRGRKQVTKRSNLLAKQVISIQSALSLGFVSQIWVDTTSWAVLVIEVRPNLLSGESERFLLEDVSRVGDVVLVEDENVIDKELKMVGLETLVGYRVVTPSRQNIGKVRGYSFNINSGALESLELDSFGISIIPSSLVSTYTLLVEDVLEVLSDTVIVHEAAASRVQRLTKGLWDTKNVGTSMDDLKAYSDCKGSDRSSRGRSTHRKFGSQNFSPNIGETEDDWELPMDYL